MSALCGTLDECSREDTFRIELILLPRFDTWFRSLRDRVARTRIVARLARLANGNAGDVRPVGEGVSELRIDHGPGYRVYFVNRGADLIVVLGGGDKSTQSRDIADALATARTLPPETPT